MDPTVKAVLSNLNGQLSGIGATLLDYAIFAATAGTIVMALLELLKALTNARRSFHEYEMHRWIDREPYVPPILSALVTGSDTRAGSPVWEEFLTLLTGGYASPRAVFDQPIEKLMAQVQVATNMALDFPQRYPLTYEFLTHDAKRRYDVTSEPPTNSAPLPPSDADEWRMAAEERGRAGDSPTSATPSGPSAQQRRGAEARARLQNLVARQLDALQTEVFYRWARTNQTVATVAGTALGAIVLVPTGMNLTLAMALSVVTGLTAPFAKDVVSGLSGFARSGKG